MRLLGQYGLIVLVTLCLAEIGARLLLPQPGLQPFPPNQPPQLLVQHPERSYAYRPGFSGEVHEAPHTIDIAINELGMRDDPVIPGEPVAVLAVGDSFTVGYMVRVEEAWPARLEHYLQKASAEPTRVLNGGVSGYSLRQIRQTAGDYADLRPDIVIAGVLPAVADRLVNPYLWYEGYAVRAQKIPLLKKTDAGFLAALPKSRLPAGAQFWLMENFRVGATLWLAVANWQSSRTDVTDASNPNTGELMDRFLDELGQLDTLVKSNGQRLVVLLIGFQQPDGSFSDAVKLQNQQVADYCARRNIAVFDPLPLFEARSTKPVFRITPTDYHWTPLAYDIAAQGLAAYLLELQAASAN